MTYFSKEVWVGFNKTANLLESKLCSPKHVSIFESNIYLFFRNSIKKVHQKREREKKGKRNVKKWGQIYGEFFFPVKAWLLIDLR